MHAFRIRLSIFLISFVIAVDMYVWQAVKTLLRNKSDRTKRLVKYIYWSVPVIMIFFLLLSFIFPGIDTGKAFRTYFSAAYFIIYLSKFTVCLFLLFDDLRRLFKWGFRKITTRKKNVDADSTQEVIKESTISRSRFISETGLIVGLAPLIIFTRGITKGAYDYTVRKVQLYLPNLPSAFEGLKVLQISDVHTGSFNDKDKVYKGIKLIKDQGADLAFFTGDLVNSRTEECYEWLDMFSEVKAPMGVYSIFGNHDYGDYVSDWKSPEAKAKNLEDLVKAHKDLGWNLLRNEHVIIDRNFQKIGLIGVENWGHTARFQKYGDLTKASNEMPAVPVKLLLSHDPSHFDYIVSNEHKDIDVTFSGHTHGFQFGVDIPGFKWSPVKYFYPHWAGLYNVGKQQLYVNRGYGFLGYPGRVGILPEITVFTLTGNV